MDELTKLLRHRYKKGLITSKVAEFESDLLTSNEDELGGAEHLDLIMSLDRR